MRSNKVKSCFKENSSWFLAQAKECSQLRDLRRGKELHVRAVNSRDISNPYVANSLINMFAKCRSMVDAQHVFNSMSPPDVVSWNSLLQGYVDNGESRVALNLFDGMRDCAPDGRTFVAALTACSSLAARKPGNFSGCQASESCKALVRKGVAIHSLAKMTKNCSIYVENSLITLYSECGSMTQAQEVFDSMKVRGVVTWNALLRGYVENGKSEIALELFDGMEGEKDACVPDARTYVAALTACATLASKRHRTVLDRRKLLEQGRLIHSRAVQSQCCDRYVESILVDMYCKLGCMEEARNVFDSIVRPDIVSWNALLQGYVDNGQAELALELFDGLKRSPYHPDARTYGAAVSACAALAGGSSAAQYNWFQKGKEVHSQAVRNRCCDLFLESMLVDMYAKGGRMVEARKVFDKMSRRDVVSWTALLQGYVDAGENELALGLFESMESCNRGGCAADARAYVLALTACAGIAAGDGDVKPRRLLERGRGIHSRAVAKRCCDVFVENSAVTMYAKLGSLEEARKVFDCMVDRNVVSWNCMLQGYVDHGQSQLALELMSEMKKCGVTPTSATFVAAVTACGNLMLVERGREVHDEARRFGLEKDVLVATCLVEFYGKCGCMDVAKEVFDTILVKDVWAWNTLICGYSEQGDTVHVFELLERMKEQGVSPNEVTFTHAITACSHSGMTDVGLEVFRSMSSKHGVSPDVKHYACVVDMLGRANRLREALEVVKTMPFPANAVIWRSLLGACRKWNNVGVAEIAYESLVKLDESDSAAYVLMANIYGTDVKESLPP